MLREPVHHLHRITAYRPGEDPSEDGTVLDLITATVTIDEDTTPRFRFNGSVGITDQELLDLLDPRAGTRLLIETGYRYADSRTELRPLADLGIRQRVVRRPQNDVTITAESDEKIVQDYVASAMSFPATTLASEALRQMLSLGHTQVVAVLASRDAYVSDGSDPLVVEPGTSWSTIQALADRINAEVYHDGLTGFYVTDQGMSVQGASASMNTGVDGSITASEVATDLEEFANYVAVVHTWEDSDGVSHTALGVAEQVTGPLGTAAIGRRGRAVTVDGVPATTSVATTEAWSILTRTISRGRRIHVEDAVARYWLRPGHTVTIQLPLGSPERAVISRVTFNLPVGSMSVHTRQPETVSAPII